MGQSLVKNYLHLIFSTKLRKPMIDSIIEAELHDYLGGTCKELECSPIRVGGYLDHVHIVCLLSKKIALMKLLEVLKSHSSKWIKTKGDQYQNFFWQDGYAAFSVSPSELDSVVRYVQNQKDHHNKTSFQDELRMLLRTHNVEFDERFVWD